jgi:peptidoglycan/xylan/chitin deacetylase (PgdA/CDA1 family)
MNSSLVISLDFEILWGVFERQTTQDKNHMLKVYDVVPKILNLFQKYEISCTWATVGALICRDEKDFNRISPSQKPKYRDSKFNSYNLFEKFDQLDQRLLFAPDIAKLIMSTPNQEIGSHTFSHYYTLEKGQSTVEFYEDLCSNIEISEKLGIKLKSIVFPRNQYDEDYLEICKNLRFTSYRGNPNHWAYAPQARNQRDLLRRLYRLIDAYIPLSGPLTFYLDKDYPNRMRNIRASIFFRPYSQRLKFLEALKLRRIKYSMHEAAKNGKVFHLWWHPHNFIVNMKENLDQLEQILVFYKFLEKQYGMQSLNMSDDKIYGNIKL